MRSSSRQFARVYACGLALALANASCAPKTPTTQPTSQPTTAPILQEPKPLTFREMILPTPQPTRVVIWEIAVPAPGISHNEALWRATDESSIPRAEHDLLLRNGIRVSEFRAKDYPAIRDLLDNVHANSKRHLFSGSPSQTVELQLQSNIVWQNIFWFDRDGKLTGQSFDDSDNFLAFTFEPSQRDYTSSHISFYPLIRSQRTHLEYTVRNNREEFKYVHPERIFDLGFSMDIPRDRVLLVGPSVEASNETSLGHALLVHQSPADVTETLLIILPANIH